MADENNPGIKVEWFDDPSWVDVTNYLKRFRVRKRSITQAVQTTDITLKNRGGKFTSGTDKIKNYSHIRVTRDVRGVWDDIFVGRYFNQDVNWTRASHALKLTCRGHGIRLVRETETRRYGEEQIQGTNTWLLKDVIEQFLQYPDSGYETGITLVTDSGLITTTYAGEECNFERTTLLDCLKKIAERINYDGYIYKYKNNEPMLCGIDQQS